MVLRHLAIEEKSPTKLLAFLFKKAVSHKEVKQAIKFGMVGVMGTMIDFAILNLLIFGAGWTSPLGQFYASVISTSVAVGNSFTWNRLWTFRARNGNGGWQFLQYGAVSIAGLLFNSGIFYITSQFVYGPFLPEAWAVQLAKLTAVGIVMFWNFGMNRFWTFRRV